MLPAEAPTFGVLLPPQVSVSPLPEGPNHTAQEWGASRSPLFIRPREEQVLLDLVLDFT